MLDLPLWQVGVEGFGLGYLELHGIHERLQPLCCVWVALLFKTSSLQGSAVCSPLRYFAKLADARLMEILL